MARSIPAPPADIRGDHEGKLTSAMVIADPSLTTAARVQGALIRAELAENGEVWFAGRGYHRDNAEVRDFAFRVLVAKGELVRDPADRRRYTEAS